MTEPTDNLQQRCAEIVEWQRTGVLSGSTLRNHAKTHWAGYHDSLQMAERDTFTKAVEWVAKWGTSPAVAGEPIGYLYCGGSYGDELADWEIVADQHQCDKLNEHHGSLGKEAKLPLYTTPQPTQAQAGEVPLTDEQLAEIMRETWGCASIAPRHAIGFARAVEAAHGIGIKGGHQ